MAGTSRLSRPDELTYETRVAWVAQKLYTRSLEKKFVQDSKQSKKMLLQNIIGDMACLRGKIQALVRGVQTRTFLPKKSSGDYYSAYGSGLACKKYCEACKAHLEEKKKD